MDQSNVEKPFRVGVFPTVAEADRAVRDLLAAGFTREQISVVCSERFRDKHFHGVQKPAPTAHHTVEGITAGAITGATIGGLALAATAIVTGGASLLAAGTVLVGGGALGGAFTGAMATRGFEREISDYYDQALQRGDILVAAEVEGEIDPHKLAQAERVLAKAGAHPVSLVEG